MPQTHLQSNPTTREIRGFTVKMNGSFGLINLTRPGSLISTHTGSEIPINVTQISIVQGNLRWSGKSHPTGERKFGGIYFSRGHRACCQEVQRAREALKEAFRDKETVH